MEKKMVNIVEYPILKNYFFRPSFFFFYSKLKVLPGNSAIKKINTYSARALGQKVSFNIWSSSNMAAP